jgi:hypothetical protein
MKPLVPRSRYPGAAIGGEPSPEYVRPPDETEPEHAQWRPSCYAPIRGRSRR